MTVPQILCIGELLFDYLADQPGQSLEAVSSWTPYPGGAPANVACALARLGTPAAYLGCLGQDPEGDALASLLDALEVNLEGLQRHPQAPTRIVYVTRTLEGDRHFAGFGKTDTTAFADAKLQASALPEKLFQTARFLVLGTLALAYSSSREAIYRALELSKTYGLSRLVDLNWRPVFWPNPAEAAPFIHGVLAQADFIKLAREEAELFFDSSDPQSAIERYPRVQGVFVTDGERGCRYWLKGIAGEEPAFAVKVVDTTGAGDAFTAGLLHQLCQQPDLKDPQTVRHIIRYASAVGALATTQAGAIAAQPTAAQVETFLATPSAR
ncbi:carbohydrate kinase [Altericista sp. CCNU0014]|uniref:carbohydrate kinase family protein n=1 Tax=Altericista sp. CCNU0014 TaxID=3082949 RepID=UPI00384A468A